MSDLLATRVQKCGVQSKRGESILSEHDDQANQPDQPEKGRVQVGGKMPNFTLPSQFGALVSLSAFLGKQYVVLYFYPKDSNSICTAQACAFRDRYKDFKRLGAEVIGISSDSVESHRQSSEEHQLPFILLSDTGGIIRKRFGVPTSFGLPGRVTYIIDRQGFVRHLFFSQYTAEKHVAEAIRVLQSIQC